jgi:hypothetical protein
MDRIGQNNTDIMVTLQRFCVTAEWHDGVVIEN